MADIDRLSTSAFLPNPMNKRSLALSLGCLMYLSSSGSRLLEPARIVFAFSNCAGKLFIAKERYRKGVKSISRLNISKCLLLVGNYIRRQTERWAKQYEASKTHDIPTMDKLISWLLASVPENDNTTVVHGDFRSVFAPIVNLIPCASLAPTKQMKGPRNKVVSVFAC